MKKFFFSCLMSFTFFAAAAAIAAEESPAAAAKESEQTLQKNLKESKDAADKWIKDIDDNNYKQSWENASVVLKLNVNQEGWNTAMQKLRKPLGKVTKRELVDIRTAHNPPGVAKGEYMVIVYGTDFANRAKANELITLVQESDGQWRVMSYFAR